MEKNSINYANFNEILNKNFLNLMERLKTMRINYNKSIKRQICSNEYDFFVIWMKMFVGLNKEEYIKIINDSSGEVVINKRSEKFLTELDVLNQNVLKLDDVLWPHFKFTGEFINSFSESKNKEQILKIILSILLGFFEDLKIINMFTDEKLSAVFSFALSKNSYLYFSVNFENLIDKNSDCYEIIKFIGIFKNYSEFNEVFETLCEDFLNDDSIYPKVEFDKTGTKDSSNYDILIFHKKSVMHNKREIFLKFPHPPFPSQNKKKTRKITVSSGDHKSNELEIDDNFDFKEFILGERNQKVFNDIKNFHQKKHPMVLDFIKIEEFDLKLSAQEKFLVIEKDNIIISGRSGTGKTTIIVFKILFSFLNFYVFKSQCDFKEITWKNVFLPADLEKEKLKYVFTSYSHSLCFKVEELYTDLFNKLCKNLNINCSYSITNYDFIKKINSFRQIETYPLFINFRKFLFLIDGTLNTQFFQRKVENKMSKTDEECDIRFSYNCEYKLNHYIIQNALNFDVKTYFIRPPILKEDDPFTKIEIDDNDFSQNFFQKVLCKNLIKSAKNLRLSPSLIFSQIHSVIKGSIFSHLSYMNCISKDEYLQAGVKLTELTKEQREVVYDIFKEYELWKWDKNYFDLQDLVNHLIRQVKIELLFKEEIKLIDYLYIDEVQDLTINQIYLLTLITRYPLVYAGDTCQTVSKSIRFRFEDLFQIFHNFTEIIDNYQKPVHAPLNNNFRFGANILKMSNFVSNLIYEIFPNSIDKFNTEFTLNNKNYLPFTLNKIESLISLMSTNPDMDFSFFTFAAFHCVICRSPDIAENLHKKYEKLKVTDITTSKGLEFEIVIIYNFFKDSNCKRFWSEVLNSIEIIEKPNENKENIKKTMNSEKLDENIITQILKTFEKLYCPKLNKEIDQLLYYEFCTELKQLYVAITRARTFLIFYDEDTEIYPLFLKQLEEIDLISKEKEEILLETIIVYLIDNNFKIDKRAFEIEGDKYFDMKRYSIAEYYYKMVNEKKAKKAHAYQIFDNITEMERDKKENYIKLNEEVLSILKEINCLDNVYGDCLINLGKYDQALSLFERTGNFRKCGKICMEIMKDYEKAFIYYDRLQENYLAIEAILNGRQYEKLFWYIKEKKKIFDLPTIVNFYKKYSHNYLTPFFYKSKVIKPKIKTNFYSIENRKNPKPFIFLINENHPPSVIDKIYKKLDIVYKFEDTKPKINIRMITFDQILLNKYDKNQNLNFLGVIDNNLFKIKKRNSYIFSKLSSFILSENEKNTDYDLTKDLDTNKTNKEKFMKLFKFIHQYISIIHEKSNLLKLQSDIITDFDEFLDEDFNRTISVNVEYLKFYPNHCNTILRSISAFENCETLKVLYSIFLTSNLSLINKEIYTKTQINFWKRNEVNSPEILFSLNKEKTKEMKMNIHNFILQNKENLHDLSNENLIQIMRIIKQLNINEDESAKLLKKLLFMNGYFESLITLVEKPLNLYLSGVTSNYKIFHRIVNNFVNSYCGLDAYVLTNHIRLNICKMLICLNKWRIVDPKSQDKPKLIRNKMDACISNLFNYVKIYELIENIFIKFGLFLKRPKTIGKTPPINFYIREFRNFLENPEKFVTSKQKILDLIEIGSTLSMFFYIYGGNYFEFDDKILMSETKEEQTILTFELLQEIKSLMILLTSFPTKHFTPKNDILNQNYHIRLVFFSLFNVFNVTTFPNEKLFNNVYGNLPLLIINTNSIIFTEEETFSKDAYKILKCKQTKNFDSKGENFLIKYKSIYNAFFRLISQFSCRLLDLSIKSIKLMKEPWLEEHPLYQLNDMIRYYAIFYNCSLIQGFSKTYCNSFVDDCHSHFNCVIYNKLNRFYFRPNSFCNFYENQENDRDIFVKILNVELTIYLSFMPFYNNKYLNQRSVEFIDSFLKILYKSIENHFNSFNTIDEIKYSKYLINFYFLNFLFCGSKQCLYNFIIKIENGYTKSLNSSFVNLNKFLNQGDYLNFCLDSINFINKNKEYFSALMLLTWIKKLSLFIYMLIQVYVHPNYSYFKFNIFCSNLPKEDLTFILEVKKQLEKKIEKENDDLILAVPFENEMKVCLQNYFKTLNYFVDKYIKLPKNNKKEQNLDENEENKEFYFNPILQQFFELEIYKIYLSFNNQIIYMNVNNEDENFMFVNENINEFTKNYLNSYQYKENFEFEQIIDFKNESIKFSFAYYNSFEDDEVYKYGLIKQMTIETETNEKIVISPSHNVDNNYILKYLGKKYFVFKMKPEFKTQEEVNSFNFIHANKLGLDEYIKLVDEIYGKED